jgi:hypothetical protein
MNTNKRLRKFFVIAKGIFVSASAFHHVRIDTEGTLESEMPSLFEEVIPYVGYTGGE